LLFGDEPQLYHFNDDITKIVIIFPGNLNNFLLCFFGESIVKIFENNLLSVLYYIIKNE